MGYISSPPPVVPKYYPLHTFHTLHTFHSLLFKKENNQYIGVRGDKGLMWRVLVDLKRWL
jgi:hypothetical protein